MSEAHSQTQRSNTPPPYQRHRWEVDDRGGARRGGGSGGGSGGGTSSPGAVSQHFFQALLLVERVEEMEDDSGGVEVAQSELRQMRGVPGEVSGEERCISIRELHFDEIFRTADKFLLLFDFCFFLG